MAIQRRSCWRRSRQKSHVLTIEFIDRAPTVRFYDHFGHMSAAVCCETSLHALTDGRRHDHREGCEDAISRGWEGVNNAQRLCDLNNAASPDFLNFFYAKSLRHTAGTHTQSATGKC